MKITYVIAALFIVSAAMAHEQSLTTWEKLGIPDPTSVLIWCAAAAGLFICVSMYYQKRMGKQAKKFSFVLIALPIAIATFYLGASTIYLNLNSVTGGPVHWHADYEVWACAQRYELVDPHSLDNKVGESAVHEHNDNRIHVEGVLLDLNGASIGEFFEAVGGKFTGGFLAMPTNEGQKSWNNGDLCNGSPARWLVFVNGKPEENAQMHVIAPYTDVPPGDVIKMVFTEKNPENVNTKLFEVP